MILHDVHPKILLDIILNRYDCSVFIFLENGQPLPFPTHPALTAALQCGPDGRLEGETSLGTRALESCAYLAQSMLAHNFRDGPPISSHEMEMFQV